MEDTRFAASIHLLTALAFMQTQAKGSSSCEQMDQVQNSETLAAGLNSNPAFVRKLLGNLIKAGIIESKRGKQGGVFLKRDPSSISLKEIYLASTTSPLVHSRKQDANKHCPVSCAMKNIVGDVTSGIEENTLQYLSKITLKSLVKKIK